MSDIISQLYLPLLIIVIVMWLAVGIVIALHTYTTTEEVAPDDSHD